MSQNVESHHTLLVYPGYLLTTNSTGGNKGKADPPPFNRHNGYLSASGAKKLRKCVSWLQAGTPDHIVRNPDTGKEFTMRLNFITLTLSASQVHTDVEVKARMLEPWLDNIRRRYKLKAYAWRAEAQKNGNIHFHVVTNRFMNMYVIRRLWNRRQAALGYIERYRREQQEWHKSGFRSRPWLYSKWPQDAQFRAWKHGLSTNWSDPNSTDVHALCKVRNAAAYIAKYMTKVGKAKCEPCKKVYYYSDPVPDPAQCKKCGAILSVEKDRPIEGRLWFVSRSLSRIKPLKLAIDSDVEAELHTNSHMWKGGTVLNDFVTLYDKAPEECTQFGAHLIKEAYEKHVSEIRNLVW